MGACEGRDAPFWKGQRGDWDADAVASRDLYGISRRRFFALRDEFTDMVVPTATLCTRRRAVGEPDRTPRTRVQPASKGEPHKRRCVREARNLDQLTKPEHRVPRRGIEHAHVDREAREAEPFTRELLGDAGRRKLVRPYGKMFRRAVMLAERDGGARARIPHEDVIGLRRLHAVQSVREGAVPARKPDEAIALRARNG